MSEKTDASNEDMMCPRTIRVLREIKMIEKCARLIGVKGDWIKAAHGGIPCPLHPDKEDDVLTVGDSGTLFRCWKLFKSPKTKKRVRCHGNLIQFAAQFWGYRGDDGYKRARERLEGFLGGQAGGVSPSPPSEPFDQGQLFTVIERGKNRGLLKGNL